MSQESEHDSAGRRLLEELLRSGSVDSLLHSRHLPCRHLIGFDDFRQEVFLRALRYAMSFRGSSLAELAAWLQSIAGNVMLDCLRKAQTKTVIQRSEDVLEEAKVTATRSVSADLADWLTDVVEGLDDEDKEILHRRYRMRQRWQEIAEALNMKPNTLAQKHLRIIQRLRSLKPPD